MVLPYKILQVLNVGGATVIVDVESVRVGAQNRDAASEILEQFLGGHTRGTVGTVQSNTESVVAIFRGAEQMVDIVLHRSIGTGDPPDVGTDFDRGRAHLVEDNGLNFLLQGIRKLEAIIFEDFDAVILKWVVGRGDDNTGVISIFLDKIGHRRSRNNTQKKDVSSHRAKSCCNGRFQHVAGETRIHSDGHFRALVLTVNENHGGGAADLHSELRTEVFVGDAACAVGSE